MATAAELTVKPAEIDPIDVSRKELYVEDTWREPFRQLRQRAPIQWVPESHFGPYWSVSTYKPIQHIEALPKLFSSSWEYGGISIAIDPEKPLETRSASRCSSRWTRRTTPRSGARWLLASARPKLPR